MFIKVPKGSGIIILINDAIIERDNTYIILFFLDEVIFKNSVNIKDDKYTSKNLKIY